MTTYTYTHPKIKYLCEDLQHTIRSQEFINSPLTTAVLADGVLLDFEKAVHVLIAGATGNGKSVMVHNILASLMVRNNPNTANFIIIDPKIIEFEYYYKDNPCLLCPVVTEPEEAIKALENVSEIMMDRYQILRSAGKRKWDGKTLYIVIDEVADLLNAGGKKLEKIIEKIARLGRGAGIHLIVATQHPTKDVLSRQITANLDTRICLHVVDVRASYLVLGAAGGEKLHGAGNAILRINGEFMQFRGAYMSDEQLDAFCHSWKLEEDKPEIQINFQTTADKFMQVLGMN